MHGVKKVRCFGLKISVVKLPVANVAGNLLVINAYLTRKLPVSYQ